MRVESMVAQQAVLAATTRRSRRALPSEIATPRPFDTTPSRSAGSGLPFAVADRLARLLASDPGLAEAVSAHMPAARRASARDLAAYVLADHTHASPRLIDTTG